MIQIPPIHRRYEHYHFRIQLLLLIIGLVGLLFVTPHSIPWLPHRIYLLWLALIIQFGLKRKVKPPSTAPGFPVLPPRPGSEVKLNPPFDGRAAP